jgi:hypothetical protein
MTDEIARAITSLDRQAAVRRAPRYLDHHPELRRYWQHVLHPMLIGIADDEALTTFLDRQIELWELEVREPNSPLAHPPAGVVALLIDTLAILRQHKVAPLAA